MTDNGPKISICIPAYKRVDFLRRLLDSIATQSYHNYEVVISDDSPASEVQDLIRVFADRLPGIMYHKNEKALGTPANWNKAILMAKGDWIKLMHDDDWFSSPDALTKFAEVASKEKSSMLFSSYSDVFLSKGGAERKIVPSAFRLRQLLKEPVTLLNRNIIGPPSVVMHRNDGKYEYDAKLKWLVDVDMYVRRLNDDKIVFIPDDLIRVGVGEEQVTASVHGEPTVEIPEHFLFLRKTGVGRLRNLLVYDYWWRFIRNFKLFSPAEIERFGYTENIHPVLLSMMSWQKRIPFSLLRTGIVSKALMLLHFVLNKNKITA